MEDAAALKKKYRLVFLIISILVFAALITALAIFILKPTKYDIYFNENYESCMADNEQMYYVTLVLKTGNNTYCEKLEPRLAERCRQYSGQADASICKNIAGQENKMCRAQLLKDPSICDKNDLTCLAIASSNPSYCSQISDSAMREECIAISTLNPDYYRSGTVKERCTKNADAYAKIAIKSS